MSEPAVAETSVPAEDVGGDHYDVRNGSDAITLTMSRNARYSSR